MVCPVVLDASGNHVAQSPEQESSAEGGCAGWEAVTRRRGNRRSCDRGAANAPHQKDIVVQAPPIGTTVSRGCDWDRGDEDGGASSTGVVQALGGNGWVEVVWSNGSSDIYRFGVNGKFDLVAVHVQDTSLPMPTLQLSNRTCYAALVNHDEGDEHAGKSIEPKENIPAAITPRQKAGAGKPRRSKDRKHSLSSQSTCEDELEVLQEALRHRASSADEETQPQATSVTTPRKHAGNRCGSWQTMMQNSQTLAAVALSMELLAIATGMPTNIPDDEPKKKVASRREATAPAWSSRTSTPVQSRPARTQQLRSVRGR